MKLRTTIKNGLATMLFIAMSVTASLVNITPASAATLTWTGEGDGTTFSDGGNWNTGLAPQAGDVIQFEALNPSGGVYDLENDLSVALAGIIIDNGVSGPSTNTFRLDTITFQANATVTQIGDPLAASVSVGFQNGTPSSRSTVYFQGNATINSGRFNLVAQIFGTGTLSTPDIGTLRFYEGSDFTGSLLIGGSYNHQAEFYATDVFDGSVTVQNGQSLSVTHSLGGNTVFTPSLTTGSSSAPGEPQLYFVSYPLCAFMTCSDSPATYFNVTGTLTLNDDLVIYMNDNVTVRFSGTINYNGHTITQAADSEGTLLFGSETGGGTGNNNGGGGTGDPDAPGAPNTGSYPG
jgi:hypothetical protein